MGAEWLQSFKLLSRNKIHLQGFVQNFLLTGGKIYGCAKNDFHRGIWGHAPLEINRNKEAMIHRHSWSAVHLYWRPLQLKDTIQLTSPYMYKGRSSQYLTLISQHCYCNCVLKAFEKRTHNLYKRQNLLVPKSVLNIWSLSISIWGIWKLLTTVKVVGPTVYTCVLARYTARDQALFLP